MICVPIGARCMCERTGTKRAERTDIQNGPENKQIQSIETAINAQRLPCHGQAHQEKNAQRGIRPRHEIYEIMKKKEERKCRIFINQ